VLLTMFITARIVSLSSGERQRWMRRLWSGDNAASGGCGFCVFI